MPKKRKNKTNFITDLLKDHVKHQSYTAAQRRAVPRDTVDPDDLIQIPDENRKPIEKKPDAKFDWKLGYDLATAYGNNQFVNQNKKIDDYYYDMINQMNTPRIDTEKIENQYLPIITKGSIENTVRFLEPVKNRDSIGTIHRFNTPTARVEIARQYGIDGVKTGSQDYNAVEQFLHRVPDRSMNNIVYVNPPSVVQQSSITVPQIAVDVIDQGRPAYPFFVGINDPMHPALQPPERSEMFD